jgi:hypothetical protein
MKEIPLPKSGLQFIDVHCHVPFEETIFPALHFNLRVSKKLAE